MSRYNRFDTVYILHFSQPYKHCRHYVGYSANVARRFREHLAGHGVGLTKAVIDAGITIVLARKISGNRSTERLIRELKSTPSLCPICNPDTAMKRGKNVGRNKQKRRERLYPCPF